ncbi:MAG: M1 family metallopeptidase [Melioribacteraceae bacterium]|nr:M1 family metallopeptidase [Melioribacteraceae bacterium]
MKKFYISRRIVLILTLLATISLSAQTPLYIPGNVKKAYDKGTRSYDGKPGQNYWINRSDYTIKAELITETRTVNGHAWITFYNNSPDSLNTFVFRLYQDVMKKGNPRDFTINPADLTDGIKIDTLIINNTGIDFKSRAYRVFRTGTNLVVTNFPSKVPPKGFAKIEVNWSVVIPKESRIRMGAYDDKTFFVAYWYPQFGVYDDVDGWDRQEYTGITEFYNDFGNFDVEITVPGENVVWATGVLQNANQLFDKNVFERYQKALNSDEIIKIVTPEDLKNKAVTNGKEKNTWHFIAGNVPDFSFGTSDKYLWDGSAVEVDFKTGRKAFVDACYEEGTKFQDEVALFARQSVEYLSHEWPGIPYPYPKMTVFNGEKRFGGGMETPMMCNNGTYPNRAGQIGVTIHEISHTYMPFYMGINERKYSWMDEGWATFLAFDLVRRMEPDADELPQFVAALSNALGNEYMIPVITPSYSTKTQGTGLLFYQQPSIAYLILRDFLGEDLFKQALHEYMNLWNGKHPIPYDFFFTFDRIASEDLSWFWKPWFFETGFADLSIDGVTQDKDNNLTAMIKKVGSHPVPVDLKVTYADGTNITFHKPASVWKGGDKVFQFKINNTKDFNKIELVSVLGPDSNKQNNVYEKK